jgi:hypothetical protein
MKTVKGHFAKLEPYSRLHQCFLHQLFNKSFKQLAVDSSDIGVWGMLLNRKILWF